MRILRWQHLDATSRQSALERPALRDDRRTREAVAEIVSQVKRRGDAALREFAERFGEPATGDLAASPEEFAEARSSLSERQRAAIRQAAQNIETFHRAQAPPVVDIETVPGVRCERVVRPLRSVGLYVPAGAAPLPSTALMLGVPAKLAACPTRIMCSPPNKDGKIHAAVLFAAELVAIDRVFKVGGAHAIAAMAYGTATIPRVDKIFGPGSKWVTAAKALVSQDPQGAARDMPAGPSEVLVIADASANHEFVASDLLSQAEHGEDSQAILITDSGPLAERVAAAVQTQAARLSRRDVIAASLSHSCILIVTSIAEAIEVANLYAPEHLILQVTQPRRWLDDIWAAGSVFLGPWAPESVGDYCSGTNHVLPTYGFARSYSSLGLADYTRSMTVQELSPGGLRSIGPIAETLAALEGLDAHAGAVSARLAALGAEDPP